MGARWREGRGRRPSQWRTRRQSRLTTRLGQSPLFRQAMAAMALLAIAALILPGDFPGARWLHAELYRLVHEQNDLREVMARLNASPAVRESLDQGFWRALFGAQPPDRPRLLVPAEGEVTLAYGWHLHPVHQDTRFHPGIDIAAPRGTPVHAAEGGEVTRVSRDDEYGLMVEIDHGGGLVTRYAHLEAVRVVTGLRVDRGQEIGTVGQSGQVTGSHLHFEVRMNGTPQDPAGWLGMTPGS